MTNMPIIIQSEVWNRLRFMVNLLFDLFAYQYNDARVQSVTASCIFFHFLFIATAHIHSHSHRAGMERAFLFFPCLPHTQGLFIRLHIGEGEPC